MQLHKYLDDLQKNGILWFTKKALLDKVQIDQLALKNGLYRLSKKNRVKCIHDDFFIIIPLEYQNLGIIPASWFIDALMAYLNHPYYIALLSASQLHGAAHQKPMQFQVMTNKYFKPIEINQLSIKFFVCDKLIQLPTVKQQSRSGWLNISSPEVTALDLCKYYRYAGYWSNVATVLYELKEKIDVNKLFELANQDFYTPAVIQRLGYLLSLPELESQNLSDCLKSCLVLKKTRWISLQPGKKRIGSKKNTVWKIYINEQIEID